MIKVNFFYLYTITFLNNLLNAFKMYKNCTYGLYKYINMQCF